MSWYVTKDGKREFGPYEDDAIIAEIQKGLRTFHIRWDSSKAWRKASTHPPFAAAMQPPSASAGTSKRTGIPAWVWGAAIAGGGLFVLASAITFSCLRQPTASAPTAAATAPPTVTTVSAPPIAKPTKAQTFPASWVQTIADVIKNPKAIKPLSAETDKDYGDTFKYNLPGTKETLTLSRHKEQWKVTMANDEGLPFSVKHFAPKGGVTPTKLYRHVSRISKGPLQGAILKDISSGGKLMFVNMQSEGWNLSFPVDERDRDFMSYLCKAGKVPGLKVLDDTTLMEKCKARIRRIAARAPGPVTFRPSRSPYFRIENDCRQEWSDIVNVPVNKYGGGLDRNFNCLYDPHKKSIRVLQRLNPEEPFNPDPAKRPQ